MEGIWGAAHDGDLAEVERLVGQDPGLLDATNGTCGATPLMCASYWGHVEVVRWLLDHGAVINEVDDYGFTALGLAGGDGGPPVVRLLLERGADPTIATREGTTPLVAASSEGQLEVVRCLLGHASAKATINRRTHSGKTALWFACYWGQGVVARALLESGADPTIASKDGITPAAIAKRVRPLPKGVTAKGRRQCAAALKVRF
jgi:ankyrin repeat protein